MDSSGVAAILVGMIGAFLAAAGALITMLAQADAGSTNNIGLIITGASATAASGALAYVVRKIASGDLVHRDPGQAEISLQKALEEAHNRETVYASFINSRLTDGG